MSEQLVANELLAFLQQKLDVMDEVSAVQICATNFSEEDVAAAKQLLYRLLNKSDRMVSRRRDGKKKSIQDVLTLLKETDPDDVLTELNELRKSVTVTGSPVGASNVNMRRGACLDVSGASFASAVLSPSPLSPPNAESAQCAPRAPRCPAPVPAAPPLAAARPLGQLLVSAASMKHQNVHRDYASVTASDYGSNIDATKKSVPVKGQNWADVEGPPIEPNIKIRTTKPNTPVYISRLHYANKAEDIVEYVRQKLKYAPRVQLLESRHNANFKAFVVRVPTCFLHLVLDENFWPQDVVFRRFHGQVPQDRSERTVHK
ncbi:hypothetical protein B5X24_HaOG212568 [Helicoverpa armigera]|uniref:Uncharacterized protein n=1 Tax=Helicoverpa armigera TaxID=29058 RepID=A0A2W1BG29_HELAM|nr:hypothetical protein B5X24_HaOG212568 [Helicoverpa armigera]